MDSPPVMIPTRNRQSAWWVAVVLAIALIAVLALFRFDPTKYHFYPRCALYVTTGLYCPGCGVLRATHQLAHGHLFAALRYNSLFILSLPLVVWAAMRYVPHWLAGETAPPLKPLWVKVGIAVVIAFSILRNIPVAPFNWLAPPG